ncbi:uncharacterized mitochondrial protein AtMg00810-like [Nicotiana tomentosiformis]|uniref:uncharacterized mitochondrial protein AtMg00810-like n=1 Tax=Nicotiana tomentosiformis TaxID=4098 RepID=UPI00388CAEA0
MSSDVSNNASTSMSINSHIVPYSSITANEHENKLRRSKRRRIEASFGPDFITTFLTENVDLDVLSDELIATFRTLVALAAIHNLVIHQMDVQMAFLNGDLELDLYTSKQWYEKFNSTLVGNGFVINEIKNFWSSKFEMKDLGETDVILGIKIKRTPNGFSLSQSHYIEKMLKRFNFIDVAPVRTPCDPSIHLRKNKESSISQTEYAKIIGSVIFFMNYTRCDIAYVVSRLSRYTHNPNGEHWNAFHRLLRYLRGTMDWHLHFNKFFAVLEGFCDANWVTDYDKVSSTSGYVLTLGAGAISWKSSKQTCIARSNMEFEFIALELAEQEAEWLRNLLADVPLWGRQASPVSLHCDTHAAIGVAKNSMYNE